MDAPDLRGLVPACVTPFRLVQRGVIPGAYVRSPLLPLAPEADKEIADALEHAGLGKVVL